MTRDNINRFTILTKELLLFIYFSGNKKITAPLWAFWLKGLAEAFNFDSQLYKSAYTHTKNKTYKLYVIFVRLQQDR